MDSVEEGEEIIMRLNREVTRGRRVIRNFAAPLLRFVDVQRLVWVTLVGISWAVTITLLITKNVL